MDTFEIELYTSYYSKVASMDTSEYVLIQISVSKPKWFGKPTYSCSDLYPDWGLVDSYKKGYITEEEYLERYTAGRSERMRLDILESIKHICRIERKTKAVLLCWEGKGKFCHRYSAGEWIQPGCKELE